MLASSVDIVIPSLVIGSPLSLDEHLPYPVSMALMVSGAGTLIQVHRPFGIGAGIIYLQDTSFTFLGAVLIAGMLARQRGGDPGGILATIFDVCFFGAFVQIVLSRLLGHPRQVIASLVTGIVITLVGVSLIEVGITDPGDGAGVTNFSASANPALGALVLLSIVPLSHSRLPWLRPAAIVIGLALGTLAAWATGLFVLRVLPELPLVNLPQPFRFGFAFGQIIFLPMVLIYLISSIEMVDSLITNCMFSRQPPEGPAYLQRLYGGMLDDGVSCLLAATFSAFPDTIFTQNNGVIQLIKAIGRHVRIYIGDVLLALGLLPQVGTIFQQILKPVLGGATLVISGSTATAGIRILGQTTVDRRSVLIIAALFGVGLGVVVQPTLLDRMPAVVEIPFDSAIINGGITTTLLSLLLPEEYVAEAMQTSAKGGVLAR